MFPILVSAGENQRPDWTDGLPCRRLQFPRAVWGPGDQLQRDFREGRQTGQSSSALQHTGCWTSQPECQKDNQWHDDALKNSWMCDSALYWCTVSKPSACSRFTVLPFYCISSSTVATQTNCDCPKKTGFFALLTWWISPADLLVAVDGLVQSGTGCWMKRNWVSC